MSSSSNDTLVRMANQIADFFVPYSDEEAIAGIREHIRSFWTPAMRAELMAYFDSGAAGLKPRVVIALEGFRGGHSPISKVPAGPEKVGQAASDAG